jgi:hypothetical protein
LSDLIAVGFCVLFDTKQGNRGMYLWRQMDYRYKENKRLLLSSDAHGRQREKKKE